MYTLQSILELVVSCDDDGCHCITLKREIHDDHDDDGACACIDYSRASYSAL
jgi:hypothetical protein